MKYTDKLLDWTIFVVCVMMVVYHLLSTQFFIFGPTLHLNTHLLFGLTLVFLFFAQEEKKWRSLWIAFALLSVATFGYVYPNIYALEQRAYFNTNLDLIVGASMVVVAIVATWKALGATLAIFTIICVGYFAFCSHLPGFLNGPSYPLYRLIPALSIGLNEGIYGIGTSVSAQMIFLFMVFGGLLQASGVIAVFWEIGKIFSRNLRSGAAQTTIVGGGLAGTITGAATTDAMIVGSFSIPFMRKSGYTAEAAGAIMAVSSTGAQIMPPVLGTAAFGLSAFTGIPYGRIALACIIPALFYFGFFGLSVHWYTLKHLHKVQLIKEGINWSLLLKVAPAFFLPLGALIVFLVLGYSPQLSVAAAIICLFVVSSFRKETRFTPTRLRKGIIDGAKGGAQIAACSATIGFIISSLTSTGLASKLPLLVESWSGGSLAIASLLVFIICYLLGCGMPTMTIYFTVATIAAPSLIALGAPFFSAHLFVMWAGVFSFITPPVAIASMVCAKMAGAPFMSTGILACRLAAATYFVPFLILKVPALTFQETHLFKGVLEVIASMGAMFAVCLVAERYWMKDTDLWETALSFAAAILFCLYLFANYSWAYMVAGCVIIGLVTVTQLRKRAKARPQVSIAPA